MHYIQLYNKTQWENCKGRRPATGDSPLHTLRSNFSFLSVHWHLHFPHFPVSNVLPYSFCHSLSKCYNKQIFYCSPPAPISFHLFSPFLFTPLPPHFLTDVTTIVCSSLILSSSLWLFSSYLSLFLTHFSSSPVTAAHSTKFRHTSLFLSN